MESRGGWGGGGKVPQNCYFSKINEVPTDAEFTDLTSFLYGILIIILLQAPLTHK